MKKELQLWVYAGKTLTWMRRKSGSCVKSETCRFINRFACKPNLEIFFKKFFFPLMSQLMSNLASVKVLDSKNVF
jgi:hypothetical protein